jgi:hypothetical protein
LLIIGVVVALIVTVVVAANAGSSTNQAPASAIVPVVVPDGPDQLIARITQLLVANGALVTAQTTASVSGHVVTKKKPSVLGAILLWFICIIPMLIYLINGSKDVQEPFTLTLTPVGGGTRVDGAGTGRGHAAVAWVLSQLESTSAGSTGLLNPGPTVLTEAPKPAIQPGWYGDPSGSGLRWWDGTTWTEHRQ